MKNYQGKISVAPMLDWTTKHCRVFHRQFSPNIELYTEMVTTGAILHASYDLLDFDECEEPLVLQLGGSSPKDLATSAQIAKKRGYSHINLNVGCPSDRVQNGRFGACLMSEAELVKNCLLEMSEKADVKVSVKHRIGIDELDSYEFLHNFVEIVSQATNELIIHARKAWLNGLSPKQNREIPPLDYERVYQIKKAFPHLNISLNGGVTDTFQAKEHLTKVDGVMIGRAAYQNPSILGLVDKEIFAKSNNIITAYEAIEKTIPYVENQLKKGVFLHHLVKPMLGAFQGVKGAKQFRRYISENAHKQGVGIEVLTTALNFVDKNL